MTTYNKKVPCECGRGERSAQAPRCKKCGDERRAAHMREARKPEREAAPEWNEQGSNRLLSLSFEQMAGRAKRARA